MSPNLTVGYMAEQINRERLDGVAARGWLADEAATNRSRATGARPCSDEAWRSACPSAAFPALPCA